MTVEKFTYNTASIVADLTKSLIGIGLTASPLLFLNLASWLEVIFVLCFILFTFFAVRTVFRQKSSYYFCDEMLHEDGIFSKKLNMDDLKVFKIRYFSTRRNREAGWFQIKMIANDVKIVVDSSLNGFDDIVKKAILAAEKNKLDLDATTNANLQVILDPKKY